MIGLFIGFLGLTIIAMGIGAGLGILINKYLLS